MNAAGWRIGRLQDIPAASQLPGFSREDYTKGMAARAPHILERWADAEARFEAVNRKTHAVRGFFGVESFGVNAFEAHEGELLVVPHDELGEGEQQEELYLVVEGRARFVCDGEPVELGPGELLYARPGVHREAVALAGQLGRGEATASRESCRNVERCVRSPWRAGATTSSSRVRMRFRSC